MAHLDPFLTDWDEKFHALVARNMMDNPFKPMLKTEILIPYDYRPWCCNHIWLHKQPLFLWQMALSMKVFGISEFAVRYPSVLMGALMVPMVYRIAVLYTKNTFIAFGAAILMCCSNFHLELISGYQGMDHNDVAFGFYVLASIWAYTEYIQHKKASWIILIGVFAGCAILNKWLTGLLVFSGWGLNILLNIRQKETRKELLHMLLALVVCVIVFLPWQLYIFNAFPQEAAFEFDFNTKHIFETVEGHKGSNEFYFNLFPEYFGQYIWVLVLTGALLSFFNLQPGKKINIALLTYVGVVYVFFSLIVASKVNAYFFVVAPICYIYMASTLGLITKIPKVGTYVFMSAILICSFVLLNYKKIFVQHHPENVYRLHKIQNTKIYKNLRNELPASIDIVMNANGLSDVEVMFYNKGINVFHYCFTPEEFEIIKLMNKRVGAFDTREGYVLPGYISRYKGTYVIKSQLKPTEPYYR